jgi:hypothetical protein
MAFMVAGMKVDDEVMWKLYNEGIESFYAPG